MKDEGVKDEGVKGEGMKDEAVKRVEGVKKRRLIPLQKLQIHLYLFQPSDKNNLFLMKSFPRWFFSKL
ncbi:MAG: hypothetical protein GY694_13700 [Gammaproteobacteria bacterium]|nr:hypothetical protein [Gammaproteobacteria bacterium]